MSQNAADRRLLQAAQEGNRIAQEELFARSQPLLRGAALRWGDALGGSDEAYAEASLAFTIAMHSWRDLGSLRSVWASWIGYLSRGVRGRLKAKARAARRETHKSTDDERLPRMVTCTEQDEPIRLAQAREYLNRLKSIAGRQKDAREILAALLGETSTRRGPKILGRTRWYAIQQVVEAVASDRPARRIWTPNRRKKQ